MTHPKFIPLLIFAVLCTFGLQAQSGMVKKTTKSATMVAVEKTETFLVLGNCGMCQRIIEKAALGAGAAKASWNEDTDQLTVVFDPAKTSADAIQKSVALAGYDNVGYKAPDAAYDGLHGCCQYDRTGVPDTAKSCDQPDTPKN